MKREKKKGMELEMLGWIILGAIVLTLVLIGFIYLSRNGSSSIDFIKKLFSFG